MKSFYVKMDQKVTTEMVATLFDKAVRNGATPYVGVEGKHDTDDRYPFLDPITEGDYFGIDTSSHTAIQTVISPDALQVSYGVAAKICENTYWQKEDIIQYLAENLAEGYYFPSNLAERLLDVLIQDLHNG